MKTKTNKPRVAKKRRFDMMFVLKVVTSLLYMDDSSASISLFLFFFNSFFMRTGYVLVLVYEHWTSIQSLNHFQYRLFRSPF